MKQAIPILNHLLDSPTAFTPDALLGCGSKKGERTPSATAAGAP